MRREPAATLTASSFDLDQSARCRGSHLTDVVAAAGFILASGSSWLMLSTRIGRVNGDFYGPYRTELPRLGPLVGTQAAFHFV